jgi:hypothetical protein
MTLEQRLTEALHEVDGFEPSPDLFARVARSLDEDQIHRRRIRTAWLASLASFAAVVVYLGLLVTRTSTGALVVPRWVVELLEVVILVTLVLLLAPLISRFGRFYVADVFRLDPLTGERFMSLFEIAYYLVFFGFIIQDPDLTRLGGMVQLGPGLEETFETVAVMLLLLGLIHAATLFGLPLVGLVFSSVVRRAERHHAGADAPPVSGNAVQADRVAAWVVRVVIGLLLLGALLGFAGIVGSFGFVG